MRKFNPMRSSLGFVAIICALLISSIACAADADYSQLDAKAISITALANIKWPGGNRGAEQVVIAGDPSKSGMYVMLIKWHPGSSSRPHFHPNDRYITVLSGTWYVGTGRKYDPDTMQPVPAGSFVTHFANQVHYDGAKDGEVVLQIVGMGPATATPATDRQ